MLQIFQHNGSNAEVSRGIITQEVGECFIHPLCEILCVSVSTLILLLPFPQMQKTVMTTVAKQSNIQGKRKKEENEGRGEKAWQWHATTSRTIDVSMTSYPALTAVPDIWRQGGV